MASWTCGREKACVFCEMAGAAPVRSGEFQHDSLLLGGGLLHGFRRVGAPRFGSYGRTGNERGHDRQCECIHDVERTLHGGQRGMSRGHPDGAGRRGVGISRVGGRFNPGRPCGRIQVLHHHFLFLRSGCGVGGAGEGEASLRMMGFSRAASDWFMAVMFSGSP